jgi:hypothetical protein
MGGPGVQRSTQFVRYLREFGYEPIVYTTSEESQKKTGCIMDNTLLKYIPKDTEIIRTNTCQPFNLIKFLTKIKLYRFFWYFFYPFFWERSALWPLMNYFKAYSILKKNNISLVYTSSAPYSSMLLGYLLQRKNKIKWVADLRDPFTDAYAWSFPSKIHWKISKIIEQWLIKKTDMLIVNTPEVKKLYLNKFNISESKIKVITNGY